MVRPADPRQCPYCGYRLTKKHGTYSQTVRLLGGAKQVQVPRFWCQRCEKTYSVGDPRWARRARYGREVQRKGLDLYFYLRVSWRYAAEWLRGEITPGAGRSRHWQPWRRAAGSRRAGGG